MLRSIISLFSFSAYHRLILKPPSLTYPPSSFFLFCGVQITCPQLSYLSLSDRLSPCNSIDRLL